jgi:hypothetical protein
MKQNREKKKTEAKEKADFAKEMEAIEKAARQQFKSDVESGAAKFSMPSGPIAPSYGYAPGHSGAPPPPMRPGSGPPPPPPRPGGPPPPPPRNNKAADAALAEELAKEGIILKVEAAHDSTAAEAVGEAAGQWAAGQPMLWWQYKPSPAATCDAEGVKAEDKVEEGASSSGSAAATGTESAATLSSEPKAAQSEDAGAENGKDAQPLQVQDRQGKSGEDGDGAEEVACFGPFDARQMAQWACEGYFNTGGGALVRQVGSQCSIWG